MSIHTELRKLLTAHYGDDLSEEELVRSAAYAPFGVGFAIEAPVRLEGAGQPKAALLTRFIEKGASAADTALVRMGCGDDVTPARLSDTTPALLSLVMGVAGNLDVNIRVEPMMFEIAEAALAELLNMSCGADLRHRGILRRGVATAQDAVTGASLGDAILGEAVAYLAGTQLYGHPSDLVALPLPPADLKDQEGMLTWGTELIKATHLAPETTPAVYLFDYAADAVHGFMRNGVGYPPLTMLYDILERLGDEKNTPARSPMVTTIVRALSTAASLTERSFIVRWPCYTTNSNDHYTLHAMRIFHEGRTSITAGVFRDMDLILAPRDYKQVSAMAELLFGTFVPFVADDGLLRRQVAPPLTAEQQSRYNTGDTLMQQAVRQEVQGATITEVGLPPSVWWTGAVSMGHEATARLNLKYIFTDRTIENTPIACREYVKGKTDGDV